MEGVKAWSSQNQSARLCPANITIWLKFPRNGWVRYLKQVRPNISRKLKRMRCKKKFCRNQDWCKSLIRWALAQFMAWFPPPGPAGPGKHQTKARLRFLFGQHTPHSCQTYHYSFCQRNQRWCDLVVRNQPSIIWEISRWPQRKCPGPRLTIRSKIKPQSHVRLDRLAGVGQKSQTIRQLRSCLFSSHSLTSPFAGESHQGISIYREGEIRPST